MSTKDDPSDFFVAPAAKIVPHDGYTDNFLVLNEQGDFSSSRKNVKVHVKYYLRESGGIKYIEPTICNWYIHAERETGNVKVDSLKFALTSPDIETLEFMAKRLMPYLAHKVKLPVKFDWSLMDDFFKETTKCKGAINERNIEKISTRVMKKMPTLIEELNQETTESKFTFVQIPSHALGEYSFWICRGELPEAIRATIQPKKVKATNQSNAATNDRITNEKKKKKNLSFDNTSEKENIAPTVNATNAHIEVDGDPIENYWGVTNANTSMTAASSSKIAAAATAAAAAITTNVNTSATAAPSSKSSDATLTTTKQPANANACTSYSRGLSKLYFLLCVIYMRLKYSCCR